MAVKTFDEFMDNYTFVKLSPETKRGLENFGRAVWCAAIKSLEGVQNQTTNISVMPCPVHGDNYHKVETLICDHCHQTI